MSDRESLVHLGRCARLAGSTLFAQSPLSRSGILPSLCNPGHSLLETFGLPYRARDSAKYFAHLSSSLHLDSRKAGYQLAFGNSVEIAPGLAWKRIDRLRRRPRRPKHGSGSDSCRQQNAGKDPTHHEFKSVTESQKRIFVKATSVFLLFSIFSIDFPLARNHLSLRNSSADDIPGERRFR